MVFQDVDTSDLAVAKEWGGTGALHIDGRPVSTGPPPSYGKLGRRIARRVRGLRA